MSKKIGSNSNKIINPTKTGILTFAFIFLVGLLILIAFGVPAGVFTGRPPINAFKSSIYGWIALFGAVLMIASPFIGLTAWALDRVVKQTLEKTKQK